MHEVRFLPDGRHFLSISEDQGVRHWESETGRECYYGIRHTGPVRGLAITPDGRTALTANPSVKESL